MIVAWPTRTPGDVGDRVRRARPAAPDDDPEIPALAPTAVLLRPDRRARAYHRAVIRRHERAFRAGRSAPRATVRLAAGRPPRAAARASPTSAPIDVAEAFRDLPGLVLLESARPGRNARWTYLTADPVAVLDEPAAGADPFADARQLVARLDADAPARPRGAATRRRSSAGSSGYLAYDLGHALERLPTLARRRPGPAAAPARAPRLGDRLGSADRRARGSAAGRSTATRTARSAACARSASGSARPRRAGAARRRRRAEPGFAFTLEPRSAGVRGRRRGDPSVHRPRRHLPGEPDPPPRDAVQRRPVAALPPAPDRRSVALLRVSRPRSAAEPAAGDPVGLAGAVPVGRSRRRASRPTRSRAPGRAAGRARRTGRSPASSSRAARTGPRT